MRKQRHEMCCRWCEGLVDHELLSINNRAAHTHKAATVFSFVRVRKIGNENHARGTSPRDTPFKRCSRAWRRRCLERRVQCVPKTAPPGVQLFRPRNTRSGKLASVTKSHTPVMWFVSSDCLFVQELNRQPLARQRSQHLAFITRGSRYARQVPGCLHGPYGANVQTKNWYTCETGRRWGDDLSGGATCNRQNVALT
jgi:hypothetical protein